jgi:hypothetical protein
MEDAKFTVTQESMTSSKQCQINGDLFFDTEGIVHKEFVPPGQTVNGNFYCDVLRWLREKVRRKQPVKWHNNSWALNHDNAPVHASVLVRQFLTSTKTIVIPHPPYAPDLTPWFFSISENKIEAQGGGRFERIEEIQAKAQGMKMLTQNDFQQCFKSWKSRWDRCINAEGEHFEGDGGE